MNIFDFNPAERKKCEEAMLKTWNTLKGALAKGKFTIYDTENAKNETFLRQYDDLFRNNLGILNLTTTISKLKDTYFAGRGAILKRDENPDYERFIPKKEFITSDNRFSPEGVEWLYIAIAPHNQDEISKHCAEAECRASAENRFGFCQFNFCDMYKDCKVVDLSVANGTSYAEINQKLECYAQEYCRKGMRSVLKTGEIKNVEVERFRQLFTQWATYTHTKMLAERIFEPVDTVDKKREYLPFQCMAQYYISLGYSGIIYNSTQYPQGKNLVLFDKRMAEPFGDIETYCIG